LKLIGSLQSVDKLPILKQKIVLKSKSISSSDIIESFLNKERVSEAKEYISQVCCGTTSMLPIFYYMSIAGIEIEDTINHINAIITRSQAKDKLIKRLQSKSSSFSSLPSGNGEIAVKKKNYVNKINDEMAELFSLDEKEMKHCLHAITGIERESITDHSDFLRSLLLSWFVSHYETADSDLASKIRKAICWLDEALYAPAYFG